MSSFLNDLLIEARRIYVEHDLGTLKKSAIVINPQEQYIRLTFTIHQAREIDQIYIRLFNSGILIDIFPGTGPLVCMVASSRIRWMYWDSSSIEAKINITKIPNIMETEKLAVEALGKEIYRYSKQKQDILTLLLSKDIKITDPELK